MSAIVTLLTDFGWRDPYVAEMKAALVSAVNALTIIDISHDVEPGNVAMAAYILNRALLRGSPMSELGKFVTDLIVPTASHPRRETDRVIGQVAYVDRFGNLITDLSADAVRDVTTFSIGGVTTGTLRRTFGDVPSGQFVAYVGSGGTVEVAIRDGSAAQVLDAVAGTEVIGVCRP